MEYIKAKNIRPSDFGDDTWYFEINADRIETRKVILFSDGQYEWTDGIRETARTWISGEPVPPFAELIAEESLVTELISASDFEAIWRKRNLTSILINRRLACSISTLGSAL